MNRGLLKTKEVEKAFWWISKTMQPNERKVRFGLSCENDGFVYLVPNNLQTIFHQKESIIMMIKLNIQLFISSPSNKNILKVELLTERWEHMLYLFMEIYEQKGTNVVFICSTLILCEEWEGDWKLAVEVENFIQQKY